MKPGDEYVRECRSGSLPEEDDVRERAGWEEFHRECGKVGVFFDRYRRKGKTVTVQVFTIEGTRFVLRGPDRQRSVFLAEGVGHDIVSASIDGYRRTGRSCLSAWLACLHMQIAQLDAAS